MGQVFEQPHDQVADRMAAQIRGKYSHPQWTPVQGAGGNRFKGHRRGGEGGPAAAGGPQVGPRGNRRPKQGEHVGDAGAAVEGLQQAGGKAPFEHWQRPPQPVLAAEIHRHREHGGAVHLQARELQQPLLHRIEVEVAGFQHLQLLPQLAVGRRPAQPLDAGSKGLLVVAKLQL